MTRRSSKIAILATGIVVLAASAPAFAASPRSDAFVARVHPNVEFLGTSSRLAVETTAAGKIRSFARGEATEQTLVGDQLVAWTQTHSDAAAEGVAASLNVDTVDDVLTGRSVATDSQAGSTTSRRTAAPGTLLPSGEAGMVRLSQLRGRRFDALFKTTQRDALRQLAALYSDYMQDGDDAALRAIAAEQLPVIQRRLSQLDAM